MNISSCRLRFSNRTSSIVEVNSSFRNFTSSFKSIVWGVFIQIRKKVKLQKQKDPVYRCGSVVQELQEKDISSDESKEVFFKLCNINSKSKEDVEEELNNPVENGKETNVTSLLTKIP